MDKQQLLKTLQQLELELSQTESVDPETLAKLQDLTDEVHRVLDEPEETHEEDVEPVTSGLKDLLLKFEADHPQLSVAVGKVADALAAMGF